MTALLSSCNSSKFPSHHRTTPNPQALTACEPLGVLTPDHLSNLVSPASPRASRASNTAQLAMPETQRAPACGVSAQSFPSAPSPSPGKLELRLEHPGLRTRSHELPSPALPAPDTAPSSLIYSDLSGLWAPERKGSSQLHAR